MCKGASILRHMSDGHVASKTPSPQTLVMLNGGGFVSDHLCCFLKSTIQHSQRLEIMIQSMIQYDTGYSFKVRIEPGFEFLSNFFILDTTISLISFTFHMDNKVQHYKCL